MNNLELLNTKDMMKFFKVSQSTIYNWISKGLPIVKIEGVLRFDKQEVIKWVEENYKKRS